MKTKVELLEEIVEKQDELIKSFGNCNCDICEKANSELASLKSQLAEADVAKTETDTGILVDMPDLCCDVCGRHPSVIITTEIGRFCKEHARYV